ncbi:acid phosphatase [Mycobacterium sp.]|uniref:acid phosphatase n=1 Tax=Mycobacterium sp. TaxID=1785 RepID=UPI003A8509EF
MGVEDHRLVLLRHGETEWSKSGRHTGRTDMALTTAGSTQAEFAGRVLADLALDNPYAVCSPRRRALATADSAGIMIDQVTPLIAEWDYGDYEGLTTPQIRQSEPEWSIWTHGCPGGESVAQVSDRADRAVERALELMQSRDVLFVSHGHFSRAVIARWLMLPLREGSRFDMPTATITICGFDRGVRQLSRLGLSYHLRPFPTA